MLIYFVSQDDITIKNGQIGIPPPPPIRTVSQTQLNPGRQPSRAPPPPPPAHKRPSQPPPPPPSQPLAPPTSLSQSAAPTKALPPPPPLSQVSGQIDRG